MIYGHHDREKIANEMKTIFLMILAASGWPLSAALDTNRIEQITGLKGAWNAAEGVFKISQSRDDVAIKVDEWKMPPFMGLTSWAAFLAGKNADTMVMGEAKTLLVVSVSGWSLLVLVKTSKNTLPVGLAAGIVTFTFCV